MMRVVVRLLTANWFKRDILVPLILTRIALSLVAWLGFRLALLPVTFPAAWEVVGTSARPAAGNAIAAGGHPFVNMWSRWDAGWYIEIARSGYKYEAGKPNNSAFFPLYPVLIRVVHSVLFLPDTDCSWLLIGIVVSNAALLAALLYLRALLLLDFDEEVTRSALFYLLIFPTTFFLSSVYTESLFLFSTVAAFYHARRKQWLIACLFTSLATLTRSQGIILLVPLVFEYFAQRDFNLRKINWNVSAFIGPPLALSLFITFLRFQFHTWSVVVDVQKPWGRHLMWPWHSIGWLFLHGPPLSPTHHDWLDFSFLVLLVAAAIAGARYLRISYTAYAFIAAIFFSSWGILGSIPRFVLIIFPLFIVLALFGKRYSFFHVAYIVTASMVAALFMLLHSQWNWVA